MNSALRKLGSLAFALGLLIVGCLILGYGVIKGNVLQFLECLVMFPACALVSASTLHKLRIDSEAVTIALLMLTIVVCALWWFVTLNLGQPAFLGLLAIASAAWATNWAKRRREVVY